MLNLSLPQATLPAVSVSTLARVMDHLETRVTTGTLSPATAEAYRRALCLLAKRLNRPAETCPADPDRFEAMFPADGFDPDWSRSAQAYDTWRKRVRAALVSYRSSERRPATDVISPDDWDRLIAAIEPLTKGLPTCWQLAPQKLIAIRSLARDCRALSVLPRALDAEVMARLADRHGANLRATHRRAAADLDQLRTQPALLPLLPPRPIAYHPAPRRPKIVDLPATWTAEVAGWIEKTMLSDWDPVTGQHTAFKAAHSNVARAAFGTYLRAALDTGLVDSQAESARAAFTTAIAPMVVADLLERHASDRSQGGLSARSTRKYLKVIRQVLGVAGITLPVLDQALTGNRLLKAAAGDEKTMTPENQAFCLRLIERRDLRLRFLTAYQPLRRAAEAIITGAAAEGRPLTARERARAFSLGACAAFAAIEIAGAPLRISNVLAATVQGEDAWVRLPATAKGPVRVLVPRLHTKARRAELRFEIHPNAYGAHETLLWYCREIRPLARDADTNDHLFPSPKVPGRPVGDSWFRAEFQRAMREIVGLPMNPHQFRHGQCSLLLHANPEAVATVAHRIGDRPQTMLQTYAFIDGVRLMRRGQDMMMGLIDG